MNDPLSKVVETDKEQVAAPYSFVPLNFGETADPKSNTPIGVFDGTGTTNVNETSAEFKSRCKALEPACGALWNIPVGICSKAIRHEAEKVFDSDEAADLGERVKLSPESQKAAKEATARIIARRTKDGEAVDIAIVSGAAAELAWGFKSCMDEIKRLAKLKGIVAQPIEDTE